MSVNTSHADNGVLIHAGEQILLFSDNVKMEFSGQDNSLFKGPKTGKIYLTTHRMIFNNLVDSDPMHSFSFPFVCLTDVEVEQPVFGANYIRGKVRAQENGHFTGEAKFKLLFKSGGAIDFAQCALKAAYIAKKYGPQGAPPPYTAPTGNWHQAPPPAYSASPAGYYGWIPSTQAFPNGPPPNTVFMSDNPPPYPGIVQPGAVPTPNGYAGGPPAYPGYGGWSAQPVNQGGFQPGYPGAVQSGHPGAVHPGYPGGYSSVPPSNAGYHPPSDNASLSMYPSIPNAAYGASANGYLPPGASQSGGAMGFSGPSNGKELEAAQSAYSPSPYHQPNAPSMEYNEPPPSYNSLASIKKEQ